LENRVLREIFEPDITRDWKKLQYDEVHDAFCSPYVLQVINLRRMRWVGHSTYREERRGVYRVGISEGKKLFGRPRRRWEDDIEVDFKEREWKGVD